MSRRNQDIPIRPRYGYVDDADVEQQTAEENPGVEIAVNTARKVSGDHHRMMTSSYSEIPFLAQYSGAEEQTTECSNVDEENVEQNRYDDDDDEEEQNSKSSSCEAIKTPKRPDSLQYAESTIPYELEGSVHHEGQMLHFVANNLEQTLKTASPVNKDDISTAGTTDNTPSTSTGMITRDFLQSKLPQLDANVLNDIEIEAQYLAGSVDNLIENLCNLLHSISSITADNVEVHKNAVNKLTDSMDANIKCMYTIMAKTEEISKSMKSTEQLSQRIREIKRLVDMLESNM